MTRTELDLDAYVRLATALAQAGDRREQLLAERGLDEDSWNALEEGWLARLERAEQEHGDQPGVPPLVAQHAEAFARAMCEAADGVLPFERYVEVTCAFQRGGDVANTLERFSVSLPTYLQAHQHWAQRLAVDPELAARWQRMTQRKLPSSG